MKKLAPLSAACSAALAAGLVLAAAAPGSALPSKAPDPHKTGQGTAAGTDSLSTLVGAIGLQAVKNQEALNAYKSWLIGQPGVAADGFYESAVDLRTRTMTLLWKGSTPLQARAVAEAKRRGITAAVRHVSYTRASVDRAMAALLDPGNAARFGGFVVTSVAGPTDQTDGLTVMGYLRSAAGTANAAAASVDTVAPAVGATAKKLTGFSATVQPSLGSDSFTTRSTDTSPFNAGGMMRGSDGSGCSSGFGIKRNGYTWVTTARHCDAASWTAWSLSSSSYGSKYDADAATGSRMLTGDGFYWVFDGAWNNSSGYHKTVNALTDVSLHSSICSSGANSGVHCGLIVDNTAEAFNDGYGSFTTMRVHATSGIAGAHGDSGGPMFIPNSDGVHEWAVGMLEGSNEAQTSSCGSLRISTTCSAYVEFSTTRKMLSGLKATLYTG